MMNEQFISIIINKKKKVIYINNLHHIIKQKCFIIIYGGREIFINLQEKLKKLETTGLYLYIINNNF